MQVRRFRPLMVAIGLALVTAIGTAGCSGDLYTKCNPGENLNCEDGKNCVSEPNFQCDTRVCAKYQGSQPFCTQSCQSDGECPDGECRKFVLGNEQTYCVDASRIGDNG